MDIYRLHKPNFNEKVDDNYSEDTKSYLFDHSDCDEDDDKNRMQFLGQIQEKDEDSKVFLNDIRENQQEQRDD